MISQLGAGKRKVQDLLAKGELWSAVHDKAVTMDKTVELGAFFDYCKRESQPFPVSAVAVVEKGFFFLVVFFFF